MPGGFLSQNFSYILICIHCLLLTMLHLNLSKYHIRRQCDGEQSKNAYKIAQHNLNNLKI